MVFVVVSSMLNAVLRECFDMSHKSDAIRASIHLVCSVCVEMLSTFVSFHKNIFVKHISISFLGSFETPSAPFKSPDIYETLTRLNRWQTNFSMGSLWRGELSFIGKIFY